PAADALDRDGLPDGQGGVLLCLEPTGQGSGEAGGRRIRTRPGIGPPSPRRSSPEPGVSSRQPRLLIVLARARSDWHVRSFCTGPISRRRAHRRGAGYGPGPPVPVRDLVSGGRGPRGRGHGAGNVGHSLGGWTALAATAVEPRIRAVVALAPGGSSRVKPGILPVTLDFRWGRNVPALYLAAENDVSLPLDEMYERAVRSGAGK